MLVLPKMRREALDLKGPIGVEGSHPALEAPVSAQRITTPGHLSGMAPLQPRRVVSFRGVESPEHLLSGKTVLLQGPAELVLDFGEEVSGFLELEALADGRSRLRIGYSESLRWLTSHGDQARGLLRLFSGTRTAVWRPPLGPATWKDPRLQGGFRYVALTLAGSGRVELTGVRCNPATPPWSPAALQSSFECSDPLLTRAWLQGAHTLHLCTADSTTGTVKGNGRVSTRPRAILDGAKRDRLLWLGDLAVAHPALYATTNDTRLAADNIEYFAECQRKDGRLPGMSLIRFRQNPMIWWTTWRFDEYGMWWPLLCWDHYLQTGDREFLARVYPRLAPLMDYFQSRLRHGLHFATWANGFLWSVSLIRHGRLSYLSLLLLHSLQASARLAEAVGDVEHAQEYRRRASRLQAAVRELWDSQRGVYIESDRDRRRVPLDANAVGLLAGAVPEGERLKVLDYLEKNHWLPWGTANVDVPYRLRHCMLLSPIHNRRVWPFMVAFEAEARFRHGDDRRALEVVRRTWGAMLDKDPSTCWEWIGPGGEPENGFASLCHPWSSGATHLLTRYVLGVQPVEPGYARWRIEPHSGDLQWARGRVPTPRGHLEVEWRVEGGKFRLEFRAPEGTRGVVRLPGPDERAGREAPPGHHVFEKSIG